MAIERASLGAAIRELRQLRGMTQSALAAAAKLAPNSIAVIERGERSVSIESLNAIAAALDIPAGCLFILGSTHIAESKSSAGFIDSLKNLITLTVKAEVTSKAAEKSGGAPVPHRSKSPRRTSLAKRTAGSHR